ncbi:MAG: nucleotide sugar dehydrogenase [Chloroflexota bacterium]|nr:nucleotide sugar dehydrogenase [Chloroflexota bacterium]
MERIAIVGSGVVGKATGKGLSKLGHDVVFVDTDPNVRQRLDHEGYKAVEADALAQVRPSMSMICVPTPNDHLGRQDLTSLEAALAEIGRLLPPEAGYHLVVIRCTVLPMVSEQCVIPALEHASGGRAGRDFGVCMNPEFLREATAEDDFLHPRLVVIGQLDRRSGDLLEKVYKPLCRQNDTPIVRTDLRTAEMVKYTHNLFNAAKISFANEIWLLSRELGIGGNQVMALVAASAEGMWNPRYGTRGGSPYDGSCLPKDVAALANFVRDMDYSAPMIEATLQINE